MKHVTELVNKVNLDTGKHRATHHMAGRIFPFQTRNPERVKFDDSFIEIIGLVVRYSLGKELKLDDVRGNYLDSLKSDLIINKTISENDLEELFSFDFSNVSSPEMLKYFPIINSRRKETTGKILLAKYIVNLFELNENVEWINFVSKPSEEYTLYDKVVNKNLPLLRDEKITKDEKFVFFDKEDFLYLFNKDLSELMKDQTFFMSHIDVLISYYLFYYIIQQSMQIDQFERKKLETWFAFEKETISKGRSAARFGYKLVLDKSYDVLINQDLIDYLNILTGEPENFYSLQEIFQNKKIRDDTTERLVRFNKVFSESISNRGDYNSTFDFKFQVNQLKEYLKEEVAKETSSRYSMSFREFSKLGFIRSRGRIGYVLNLSQKLLLMFVGVIIGEKEKILLDSFFEELECRGIMLDAQSRRIIINYLEDINLLEKLSDSGDAQYVKSIL